MVELLLVAPTIDGSDVGEAWVAYQWASRLSQRHHVTVLTYHKRGRPSARSQLPSARVVEWTEPPLLGRNERFNSLLKPGYLLFYARARAWIRGAHRRGERFDVAHQVTPVAMRYPTPLAGLGIPYVYGPVGGSLASPEAFRDDEGTSPWYTRLRAVDHWRLSHDRLLRRGFEDAALVLGIAPYVREALSGVRLREFEVLGETGLEDLPDPSRRSTRGGPLRLLYVGRLVRSKGARDAIRAMGRLTDLDVHLDIVGDGPDEGECLELCSRLGLQERVSFHGRVNRSDVDEFYRTADIFVFPSYREPGGNVQFEAMSYGLPLVVSTRGGTAAAVTADCAVLVDPRDPEQYAADLAEAIRGLVVDRDRRAAMGAAALEHVRVTGLWATKIDRIDECYDRVRAP